MAKLTREQKIELYKKRKQGETVSSLSKEYQIRSDNIKYLVRLIDRHGFDILRSNKNNYYSPELKLEIINPPQSAWANSSPLKALTVNSRCLRKETGFF